jgi:hypothetical protein
VALVTIDVSVELIVSIIRVTKIGLLGTLAATGNRAKHRFLQEPHGVFTYHVESFRKNYNIGKLLHNKIMF